MLVSPLAACAQTGWLAPAAANPAVNATASAPAAASRWVPLAQSVIAIALQYQYGWPELLH
jgi:hypothetical protein